MDPQIADVMRECTEASDAEHLTFPEVVMKLMTAGVERYHADLLRAEKTYYLPTGASVVVPAAAVAGEAPQAFSGDGVAAAIRAIQTRQIGYKDFCERIVRAGCVGYLVSMAGRRAVYYGRTGESYVEPFPSAP